MRGKKNVNNFLQIQGNIKNNINDIHNIINTYLHGKCNFIKRKRTLSTPLLFEILCKKNYSGHSYKSIMCSLKIEQQIELSDAAVINY